MPSSISFTVIAVSAEDHYIKVKQDERHLYAVMKTLCPPGYHHNGFVATHVLGHMMYGYTLLVPMNQSAQQAKQGA